jgi:Uma2 family endonuclease
MLWNDVITSPYLRDLPFKIELNKWGKIEMSPASNQHGFVQGEIYSELKRKRDGKVIIECSIQTTDGVRVADVAWISNANFKQFGQETPYPHAPEVCVEIMSPSNTWAEMHMKASLYLQAGAKEVWVQPINGKRLVIKPE